MQNDAVDYALFFRTLTNYEKDREELCKLFISSKRINEWLDEYDKELTCKQTMQSANPKYILSHLQISARNSSKISIDVCR